MWTSEHPANLLRGKALMFQKANQFEATSFTNKKDLHQGIFCCVGSDFHTGRTLSSTGCLRNEFYS